MPESTSPFKSNEPSQHELARVVSGITAFMLDFDGPATAYIGTTMYDTLCSHGIKAQGDPAPTFGFQEAIEMYGEQLRAMVKSNQGKQLAWRVRPQVSEENGGFRVYSRLAFI